jgi:hypothetical protein
MTCENCPDCGGTGKAEHQVFNTISKQLNVPSDYLSKASSLEQKINPQTGNLFNFVPQTWDNLTKQFGDKYGIKPDDIANPAAQSVMAGLFANANNSSIKMALGVDPTHTDTYLGHFLGPQHAVKFIRQNFIDPDAPVSSVLPGAIVQSNPGVFLSDGKPRSVGEIYNKLNDHFQDGTSTESK